MRVTVSSNTRLISAKARAGAVRGVTVGGEHILGLSQPRVPVAEATLVRSGRVDVDPGALLAAISYGSPGAEDYAVKQHEDLTLNHPSGGEAKWLETSLVEGAQDVGEIMAAEIRRALR